ncbi:hypothetical protein BZA05DRAFT_411281 [Tricharina praecox]|uniref:uncharacterized protein n=1 Tax=Tricharina praecox TaxID=43433 RepID=UPI00221FDFDE|nr:uncharacterized protein BZA05DRAFT_411281 [Tricharina praecox]KAI5843153.1 hypothetical protein BZA05DRAFT_411281 [Tricharina praecox]
MVVDLNPRVSVGAGPWGQRNWISFTGGRWAASWGSGVVVEGGQDSQLVIGDLSARLDTSYLLATNDVPPAYIAIRTQGWRTGPREVLERLGNPATADAVAPAEYSFRLYISMETGDGRYNHTNTKMWIASGARLGSKVVYDAYLV